jgi:hypothetical protein
MKTITKIGNRTDEYKVGEFVMFKWNRRWEIVKVVYSTITDETKISLQKEIQ